MMLEGIDNDARRRGAAVNVDLLVRRQNLLTI